MKKISTFLFYNIMSLYSVCAIGQNLSSRALPEFINSLLTSKKIVLSECDPYQIDTINGMVHQSLTAFRNKLDLVYETSSLDEYKPPYPISYIMLNNKRIDSIYTGNDNDFNEKINNGLVFDMDPSFFSIDSVNYFLIPCGIKNCNGSACRITIYYLVRFTFTFNEVYCFKNDEIPFQNLFRLDKKNNLYFINIINSFSDFDSFTPAEQKYIDSHSGKAYLKISALLFNPTKKIWTEFKGQKDDEYYILLEIADLNWSYDKKYRIIKSCWTKDL